MDSSELPQSDNAEADEVSILNSMDSLQNARRQALAHLASKVAYVAPPHDRIVVHGCYGGKLMDC